MLKLAYPVNAPDADIQMMAWKDNYDYVFPKLKEFGYGAVELLIRDAITVDKKALRFALTANGLQLSMIGTGPMQRLDHIFLMDADAAKAKLAYAKLVDLIELGAELNTPVIVAKFRGNSSDNDGARLTDFGAIMQKADRLAGEKGVTIYIEPQNPTNINNINTVADGVAFIKEYGLHNTKLLMDIFHMDVNQENIAEDIVKYKDYIGSFHLSDSSRRIPGFGHIDFGAVLKAIKESGFTGYASTEVKQQPDAESCARLNAQAIRYLEVLN